MDTESFAAWLKGQGHKVIRTESSYWYDAGPRCYQAFPYHRLIEPPEGELRKLMVGHGAAALRYSTPMAAREGMASYHVVLQGPYALEMLRAQARNGVRRGLKCFQIERISFERLADDGWALQKETLARQCRDRSMDPEQWRRICLAAAGRPGFEAWGATAGGELAASLFLARVGDVWCVPYANSSTRFLRDHVNNVLFFTVSCDLLAREGTREIFFGLHSLDAPESIDEFKFRMGIAARPVRQRVVFHPLLAPLASRHTHAAVARLLARRPGSPVLAKAEGMLRFHLQGRRPLDAQAWPECLSEREPAPAA